MDTVSVKANRSGLTLLDRAQQASLRFLLSWNSENPFRQYDMVRWIKVNARINLSHKGADLILTLLAEAGLIGNSSQGRKAKPGWYILAGPDRMNQELQRIAQQ